MSNHEKEVQTSDDEQNDEIKDNQNTDISVDSASDKQKSVPKSSIDILIKVFPTVKTTILSNALKECRGDVLKAIESLVNSGVQSNGKRRLESEKQNEDIGQQKTNTNDKSSHISSINYKQNQTIAKDLSPKNKCSPQMSTHSPNISEYSHPSQQPFLSMLTNMSNNAVGIPPPLVSSMQTSGRTSLVSSRSHSSAAAAALGTQFAQTSNLNSLPRSLFGSMGSPYAGLFPVFPTAAANLNFSLFAGTGTTAHSNCSPNTPFTVANDVMPLDHIHVPLKRNSNAIIAENDWFADSKRISSNTLSVNHEKKINTEFVNEN